MDRPERQTTLWLASTHFGGKRIAFRWFYRHNGHQRGPVSGNELLQPENHQVFKDEYRLTQTLLADEKGEVGKVFGVAMSGGGDMTIKTPKGKEVFLARGATAARWTWIVGKDGTVICKNVSAKPDDDAKQVLEFLQDLNTKKP